MIVLPLERAAGIDAAFYDSRDPARHACQAEILARGGHLPVLHRTETEGLDGSGDRWFVGLRETGQPFAAGFAVDIRAPRHALGHHVLRVGHFGAEIPDRFRAAAAEALAHLAKRSRRTLRTNVGIFAPTSDAMQQWRDALASVGFTAESDPWGYQYTLMVDLQRSEEEILASFSRSGRRNIREITKYGIEVEPVTDPALVGRIDALMTETMGRTGGTYVPVAWANRLELARAHPNLVRLVGAYLGSDRGPDSLVAFAWSYNHGAIAEYSDAASLRIPGSRAPLAYALVWDLIRWARGVGASWVDLGGVTAGRYDDATDPLGGISDFKRSFSEDVRHVGTEMVLHATTIRATAARWLTSRRAAATAPSPDSASR